MRDLVLAFCVRWVPLNLLSSPPLSLATLITGLVRNHKSTVAQTFRKSTLEPLTPSHLASDLTPAAPLPPQTWAKTDRECATQMEVHQATKNTERCPLPDPPDTVLPVLAPIRRDLAPVDQLGGPLPLQSSIRVELILGLQAMNTYLRTSVPLAVTALSVCFGSLEVLSVLGHPDDLVFHRRIGSSNAHVWHPSLMYHIPS